MTVTATCDPTDITNSITFDASSFTVTATANTDSCEDLEVKVKATCAGQDLSFKIDNLWKYADSECDGTTGAPLTFDLSPFAAELNGGNDPSSVIGNLINVCSMDIELEQGDNEATCSYTPAAATALNAAGNSISYVKENPAGTTGLLFAVAALAGLAVYAVKRRNRAKKSLINDDMLAGKDGQVV
jgi:hypothetical protein